MYKRQDFLRRSKVLLHIGSDVLQIRNLVIRQLAPCAALEAVSYTHLANNNSLDLVANVDVGSYVIVRVVRQLTQRDIRSVLNAQIYLYVVIGNTYNGACLLYTSLYPLVSIRF